MTIDNGSGGSLTSTPTKTGDVLAGSAITNLQTGLWSTLVARYPNPTITNIQAQLSSLQQQVAQLLAASNPVMTPAPDPVVVAPF